MQAVTTDLSKCLNIVTRGIKLKSEPLFPIFPLWRKHL